MESKLEKYLSNKLYTRFGQYSIRQNYRPDWMEGLELDFYIDELKLAAEVQGLQHYEFVEYFHKTKDDFDSQKIRDEKKRIICRNKNILLIEIFTEKDADLFVKLVYEKSNKEIIEYPKPLKIFKSHGRTTKQLIKIYNKHLLNLWLYEHGVIQASKETVKSWERTVASGVVIKGTRRW